MNLTATADAVAAPPIATSENLSIRFVFDCSILFLAFELKNLANCRLLREHLIEDDRNIIADKTSWVVGKCVVVYQLSI